MTNGEAWGEGGGGAKEGGKEKERGRKCMRSSWDIPSKYVHSRYGPVLNPVAYVTMYYVMISCIAHCEVHVVLAVLWCAAGWSRE